MRRRGVRSPRDRTDGPDPMNSSAYWQQELMRENLDLRDWIQKAGVGKVVRLSVSVERYAFLTAYIMRKLNEVDALTRDVVESQWAVTSFELTAPIPPRYWFRISEDRVTWRQPIEQHFALDRGREDTMTFEHICNRFVHHFAFDVRLNHDGATIDILFNSDRTKTSLWSITLENYMRLVDEVAYDQTGWIDASMSREESPVVRRRRPPHDW